MGSLEIERRQEGRTLHLTLKGQIDEHADYGAATGADVDRIVFDFEEIRLINSTGLQRWIKFLESIPAKTELVFERCSVRVITQLNMFPGFLGGRPVEIESFFAPYFCESCDKSYDLLLETNKHFPKGDAIKAPRMSCPTCKGPTEFDRIEKKYFLFLKP